MEAGVPWEVAIKMSRQRRIAFIVAAGERKGGSFDWRNMTWVPT